MMTNENNCCVRCFENIGSMEGETCINCNNECRKLRRQSYNLSRLQPRRVSFIGKRITTVN